MEKKVVIYTFKTCPYCHKVKALLDKEKISFTEIDVTHNSAQLKVLEEKTKSDTVPQVFVNDEFIGGCDDVVTLHKQGEFDRIFR